MSGETIAFVKVNIIVNDKDLTTKKQNKAYTYAYDLDNASRTLEINDT